MSSSSAKPFGSNDNSASPRDERSSADRQRGDGESPYAPKRVRGGFIAEPAHKESARNEDDDAPPRFLLGSRQSDDDQRGLTDFPEGSLHYGNESAETGMPRERHSGVDDTWQRTARNPGSSGSGGRYFAETFGRDYATGRNEELPEEDELRRLEESVNQLQQELATSRTRDTDPGYRRRREETYIEGFRVPPSLQPEIMAHPPELRSGRGRAQTLLGALTASIVAAPIAYYVATSEFGSKREQAPDIQLAAAESSQPRSPSATPARPQPSPAPVAKSADPTPPVAVASRGAATSPAQTAERLPPSAAPDRWPAPPAARTERSPPPRTAERTPPNVMPERSLPFPTTPERAAPSPAPERAAPSPVPERVAPTPAPERAAPSPAPERAAPSPAPERAAPSPAPERAAPSPAPAPSANRNQSRGTRVLDAGEIDLLVKQGQQFVAAGDLVTARMVFQRAAEAGNAVAALALGASYDPTVLSSLGVRGVDADVNKARAWYQKAKEFGSAEASRRLEVLANR